MQDYAIHERPNFYRPCSTRSFTCRKDCLVRSHSCLCVLYIYCASWFSAIDTLALLHKISPTAVDLENYGKATGFYTRQLKTFAKLSPLQGAAVSSESGEEVGPIPHWQALTTWFNHNVPQDRTSIVHGDYKIDNCVFHETEPRVIGILDWELSTIGHPLSDIANLFQPHGLPAGNDSGLSGFLGRDDLDGIPSLEAAQNRYASTAGWDPSVDWTFAQAFAHLRASTPGIRLMLFRLTPILVGCHHSRHRSESGAETSVKFEGDSPCQNVQTSWRISLLHC